MKFSYYPGCTLKTKAKDLDAYGRRSAEALGITLEIREECAASLAERGCDAVYGARPLRRLISTEVEDVLATCLLDGTLRHGDTAVLRAGETALHLSKKEETALAAFGAHENEAEV